MANRVSIRNVNPSVGEIAEAIRVLQRQIDTLTNTLASIDTSGGSEEEPDSDAPIQNIQPYTYRYDWLIAIPSEFNPTNHDASKVTTGVFPYERLPFTSANVSSWNTAYDRSVTGITGSGNSSITLQRQGTTDLTLNTSHTHVISEVTGLQTALDNRILVSDKGIASGVATLDGNAKIPLVQLPDSILGQVEYQGTWNANTNTPTLPDPTTVKGHYYVASTGGTFNTIVFAVGDWVISDGTKWDKVDNTDAVTSVAGRTGAITLTAADISTGTLNTDRLDTVTSNIDTNTAHVVVPGWLNQGKTVHSLETYTANSDYAKPSGYTTFLHNTSLNLPIDNEYFYYSVLSRRDAGGGYFGVLGSHNSDRIFFVLTPVNTNAPSYKEVAFTGIGSTEVRNNSQLDARYSQTDTDTTYSAGGGLSLTGTTFSVDSTVVRTSLDPQEIFGAVTVTKNNTNTFTINKTNDTSYAGLQFAVNNKANWLLYTANNQTGNLVLQTRNYKTDGGFIEVVLDIDWATATVDLRKTPTVNGNVMWHAGNFDPSSKLNTTAKAADSDKLDGFHASDFALSRIPADFWQSSQNILFNSSGGSDFFGYVGSQGSYRSSWIWNGYRNNSGTWTSLGVNNYTSAAGIEQGNDGITFRTSEDWPTGNSISVPIRGQLHSDGSWVFGSPTGGAKGANTVNIDKLYIDGVDIISTGITVQGNSTPSWSNFTTDVTSSNNGFYRSLGGSTGHPDSSAWNYSNINVTGQGGRRHVLSLKGVNTQNDFRAFISYFDTSNVKQWDKELPLDKYLELRPANSSWAYNIEFDLQRQGKICVCRFRCAVNTTTPFGNIDLGTILPADYRPHFSAGYYLIPDTGAQDTTMRLLVASGGDLILDYNSTTTDNVYSTIVCWILA